MSNEIIDAYDAVITRLKEANADGMPLAICTLVTKETLAEVVDNSTLPHLRVFPTDITKPIDTALGGRQSVEMTLLVRLREDPQYGLYNDDKTRGLLWLLQAVMNAIDGSNLTASGDWGMPPQYSIKSYVINDAVLQYDLEVKIVTPRYSRGTL